MVAPFLKKTANILFKIPDTARKTKIYFPKCSKKMLFPKKIALEDDFSCIIRKDDISLSRKYDLIL